MKNPLETKQKRNETQARIKGVRPMDNKYQIRGQALQLADRAIELRQAMEDAQDDGRDISDSEHCKYLFDEIEKISREIKKLKKSPNHIRS